MALAVGAFAAGAVEPLLEEGSVGGVDFAQGVDEDVVIGWGAVGGVVAVPGGDVDAHLEVRVVGVDGGAECAEDVEGVGYGVVAEAAGPEAEAVVVLGGEDDAAEAGLSGHVDPLAAVEGARAEEVGGFGAGAPLGAAEGVGAEVAEHVYLHALPRELGLGGYGAEGLGRASGASGQNEECRQQGYESLLHDVEKKWV